MKNITKYLNLKDPNQEAISGKVEAKLKEAVNNKRVALGVTGDELFEAMFKAFLEEQETRK